MAAISVLLVAPLSQQKDGDDSIDDDLMDSLVNEINTIFLLPLLSANKSKLHRPNKCIMWL